MFEDHNILTKLRSGCGLYELKTILRLDDVLPDLRAAKHVPISKWHYNLNVGARIYLFLPREMLQRMWTLHISIRMQRKYCRSVSYLETMKYCKQYLDGFLDVFPRSGIWCQHSKLHSLTEKPDYLHNKSKILCYSAKRNTSDLNPCYSILQHNRWLLTSQRNMNNTLSASSVRPHFQIRHISGQSGVETFGAWTHVYQWLSESTPVGCAQDLLLYVHNSTGLPWWTNIILATVFLRTVVTLPLAFYQNYILAKVENLHLVEMPEIVKELKKETAVAIKQFSWTEDQARKMYNYSLRKQWNNLIIRDNCHPLKATILLWVQLPMWIFLSVALRNFVHMLPHRDGAAMVTCMELSVGGFGWIPNLLVPDESLILPVSLGLINLAIVELQVMSKMRKKSKLQQYMTHFFRLLSLAMIPIAASVPSCLNLYWMTSSAYGLVQNLVLLSPRVKRLAHIPETPNELSNPYRHIVSEIRLRVNRIPVWWKSEAKN